MLISVFVGLNAYGGMSGHVSHQNITVLSITLKLIIFLMCLPKVRVFWGGDATPDDASPCKISQFQKY